MTVIEYYNWFMELSQYSRVKGDDVIFFIARFMAHLRPGIKDKISTHRFDSLVDCFVLALLAENSVEVRFQEC